MPVREPDLVIPVGGGRVLAADDVGDPGGRPVLYIHGTPDCRLGRHPDDGLAAGAGVRLIALDRPGYGASDPDPELTYASFGADLGRFLDGVGLDRVSLLAWSAGASWALAAAGGLGDRVSTVVSYAVIAPMRAMDDDGVVQSSSRRGETGSLVFRGELTAGDIVPEFVGLLVPPAPIGIDLARDHVRESLSPRALAQVEDVAGLVDQLAVSLIEAVARHGTVGLERDFIVQLTPGVDDVLLGATCPVRLVHGEQDRLSGAPVGQWFVDHLADASLEVWPDAGHHGLFGRWADLLALTA